MIRSKRVLTVVGAVLFLGWGALGWMQRGASGYDGLPAVNGRLSPYEPSLTRGWTELIRIDPAHLGAASIQGLDASGDTLFLVQRSQWTLVPPDGPIESHGSTVRGDPNWIGQGLAIAVLRERVAVLDRARAEISYWSRDGVRLAAHSIRDPDVAVVEPESLVSDGNETLFLSLRKLRTSGEGEWLVVRIGSEGAVIDTVYRADTHLEPWGVMNPPAVAARPDGTFQIAPANEWKVFEHGSDGERRVEWSRPDGPRWVVPDSIRREYAGILDRIPAPMRRGLSLPEHFPPVQAIGDLGEGRRAVLVAAGWDDEVHLEIIGSDGSPLGRLWEDPEVDPVFLVRGGIYRIRELPETTLIERLSVVGAP